MSNVEDSLLRYLLQYAGQTPEQQNIYGMIPQTDPEGDPVSLTSQLNQFQDVNQLIDNPIFQGMGGMGGFSQQSFAPTVNYEMVDSPEYQQWRNYLNPNNQMSFEGLIANGLQSGDTPYSALRKIQLKIASDPEGELAQMMATFFPAMDDLGMPTGEIDWVAASQGATKIDEIRAAVPQLGGSASYTMDDGTMVPGGEIMEVDGQLVRRTEEPSELMQAFNEAGLPSPYDEYSIQDFLPPDWSEQPYQQAVANTDAARQAMLAASQELSGFTPGQQMPRQPSRATKPAESGPGTEYVGSNATGTEPLTGGQGIGRTEPPAQQRYDPLSGAMMSIEPIQPSLEEMYSIQSPQQFLDWYLRNANSMTDAERWEAIGHAQDQSFGNAPGPAGVNPEWSSVVNELNSDLTQTRDSGSPMETVGSFFADRPISPGDAAFQEAQLINDATEFSDFIAANWGAMSDDQRIQLGNYANDRGLTSGDPAQRDVWNQLGRRIVQGDYQEPTAGGGGGSRPRVIKPRGKPATPSEPVPPSEREAMQAAMDQYGNLPVSGESATTRYQMSQQPRRANPSAQGGVPTGEAWDALSPQQQSEIERQAMLDAAAGSYGRGAGETRTQPRYDPLSSARMSIPQQMGPPQTQGVGFPVSGEARGARPRSQPVTDAMLAAILPSGPARTGRSEQGSPLPRSESVDWYPEQGSPNLPRSESVDWYPQGAPGRMTTGEQLPASERTDWYNLKGAPEGLQGESYEVTTGSGAGSRRQRKGRSRTAFRKAWEAEQAAKQQTYGYDYGYALGMARNAQRQGIRPLQQVYAQRMQNILNAGIPLQNQPALAQY